MSFCPNCGKPLSPDGSCSCGYVSAGDNNAPLAGSPASPPGSFGPPPGPAPAKSGGGFDFMKFLNFESMITPLIMKILFVVVSGLILLGGLIAFVGILATGEFVAIFLGLFGVPLGVAFGLLFWRIVCEQMILFFSIHRELVEIKKNTGK